MSPAEIARAMGEYIRKKGFSPELGLGCKCGCFMRAYCVLTVGPDGAHQMFTGSPVHLALRDVIGCGYHEYELERHGWTRGCTDDAAAACDIAADLLS